MTCGRCVEAGPAIGLIVVSMVLASSQPTLESFLVTDLDTLGGDRSSAFGVDNGGQIVGIATTPDDVRRSGWRGAVTAARP